jgi:hypothetical protein
MAISIHEEAIMKQRRPVRIFVAAAIATATLAWTTQSALGAVTPTRLAKSYVTWLSRAMDDCTSPVVTVTSPKLPGAGCLQANVNTDTLVAMSYGTLIVGKGGKVVLMMRGATMGDQVQVQLTLRVTLPVKAKSGTTAPVTFPDVQATCPAVTANARGVVLGATSLSTCLGSVKGLAGPVAGGATTIEILDASVLNVGTGDPVATSGVVH